MLYILILLVTLVFLLYKVCYEIPKQISQVNARAHLIELNLKKLDAKLDEALKKMED